MLSYCNITQHPIYHLLSLDVILLKHHSTTSNLPVLTTRYYHSQAYSNIQSPVPNHSMLSYSCNTHYRVSQPLPFKIIFKYSFKPKHPVTPSRPTIKGEVSGEGGVVVTGGEGSEVALGAIAGHRATEVPGLLPRQSRLVLDVEALASDRRERRVAALAW